MSSGRLVRGSPVTSSFPGTLGRVAGKSVLYDRLDGAWIQRAAGKVQENQSGPARVQRARRSGADRRAQAYLLSARG